VTRAGFGASCLGLLLLAPAAHAAQTVVVMHPLDDDVMTESATRLTAELQAAGFLVVKAACVADDNQCLPAKSDGEERTAEIRIWPSKDAATIDVTYWSSADTAITKYVTVTDPGQAGSASFLAIQAFDLLQLTRQQHVVERRLPAAPAGVGDVSPEPLRFVIDLGGAFMPGWPGGLNAAGGPAAQAWLLSPRYVGLALSLTGPLYSSRLQGTDGSASLRQESGSLLACWRPFPRARVQPAACAGAGLYHAAIEGRANDPARSLTLSHWSALGDLGLETLVFLSRRAVVNVQARTWWLRHYPQLSIGGARIGEIGDPALVISASVGYVL
jgi:hypothetical protein